MSDNPFAPPTAGLNTLSTGAPKSDSAPPSARGAGTPTPFDQVHQNLESAQKQYKNNMKAYQVIDHVRREMDDLMEMGDMVRPEDVIQAAGRLVGHGLGAENLAQVLGDMPTVGGQGLASWIRMHDVTIRGAEAKLGQETDLMRHRLAIAGFRSLAAIHAEDGIRRGVGAAMSGGPGPGPGPTPSQGSSLSPSPGPSPGEDSPQASVMDPRGSNNG
jgi:hypothetical protein